MECNCNNPKPWTTSTGHMICGNCGDLSPDSPRKDCRHIRSKITEDEVKCSECGKRMEGINAGPVFALFHMDSAPTVSDLSQDLEGSE
jgi:hypothetical protein